jgi:hypothetical protein
MSDDSPVSHADKSKTIQLHSRKFFMLQNTKPARFEKLKNANQRCSRLAAGDDHYALPDGR